MNRTLINFWLDAFLLVLFAGLIAVSTILHYIFPPGPDAVGWTLWGASYEQWRGLQFALLGIMTLSVLLHVMLHWSWVCGVLATKIFRSERIDDGTQTLYGVATLIMLLIGIAGLCIAALFTIRPPSPM